MSDEARDFSEVLDAELNAIYRSRSRRDNEGHPVEAKPPDDSRKPGAAYKRASRSQLFGLALSGGGIRSATFNLGVLQALASLKLLRKIDYLSTVSGGGYIGSFLISWISRKANIDQVEKVLDPKEQRPSVTGEPKQVRFLRDYSNYLTPRKGISGADFWTMVVTYLRNLSLNLLILVLAIIPILIFPHLVIRIYKTHLDLFPYFNIFWALGLFVLATIGTVMNLSSLTGSIKKEPDRLRYRGLGLVSTIIILPLVLGTFLLNHWLWQNISDLPDQVWIWALISGLTYLAIWLFGSAIGYLFRSSLNSVSTVGSTTLIGMMKNNLVNGITIVKENYREGREEMKSAVKDMKVWVILVSGLFAGAVGGLLLRLSTHVMFNFSSAHDELIIFGVPMILGVFMATATLHIGLARHGFSVEAQEWWSRLGAYTLMFALLFSGVFGLALFGASVVHWLLDFGRDQFSLWVGGGVISGWLLTTIAGIIAGRSASTGNSKSNKLFEAAGKVSPFVFVVGLLLLMEFLADFILGGVMRGGNINGELERELFLIVLFAAAAYAVSRRVGINEFSMHAFYRNRLVRCYLGATNDHRNPNPFTDIDPTDDNILLRDLYDRQTGILFNLPLPIINTTLNLVQGNQLAWQQRKASSFVWTPIYSGYEYEKRGSSNNVTSSLEDKGYRPTEWYGDMISLGNALTISGAAVSPNMGYHSSPPLAFLMTVFNVRLGGWLVNPRSNRIEEKYRGGPKTGLLYLLLELLGKTNDKRHYVYLSDGGHFENLGLYELVRRRCRYVIVCDAGADPILTFGDLGNAIEKCRTDFGVNIEIDISQLQRSLESTNSGWHCAIGRIRYDALDSTLSEGTLLYIKTSLTGDEPTDVLRYASECPEFPHQSTLDQFFDESQFESYRALGYHIAMKVIESSAGGERIDSGGLESLFLALRERWYPPSRYVSASFSKHALTLDRLMEKMRTNKDLQFLDAQLYPEWESITMNRGCDKIDLWLPQDCARFRAGFYICNEMIQLMENVYLDLHLDEESDHPDNAGWMNLFNHWTWSAMFQVTWSVCASTFGVRFQAFCDKKLDLHIGQIILGVPQDVQSILDLERKDAQSVKLNFLEIQIIRYFSKNGYIGRQDRIIPLQISIGDVTGARQSIEFSIGLCIIRTNAVGGSTLLYLRIQDHLRKMGLGRKSIELLCGSKTIGVNAVSPEPLCSEPGTNIDIPEDACQSAEDYEKFKNMFASAGIRKGISVSPSN